MLTLAIDTSGSVGAVGCGDPAAPLGEGWLEHPLALPPGGGRPVHGRELAPAVAGLLAQGGWAPADLGLVVIGCGPGSYTGIRVGLAFVKGFALAADCPMVGVSSLEVLAHNAPAAAGEVLVVRDAKWGEVYWARFRREGGALVRHTPDAIGPVADLDPAGAAVVGDVSAADAARVGLPDGTDPADPRRHPAARPCAALGLARYQTSGADAPGACAPRYLRPTEAERALDRRTGR